MALATLAACAAPREEPAPTSSWPARPAEEWNARFAREEGWTGADGVFCVALDGRDALGSAEEHTRTLFWFSDTTIGSVADHGGHAKGMRMVNNSCASFVGAEPDREPLRFLWREGVNGSPMSMFVPSTPAAKEEEWYWLGDGFLHADVVAVFGMRMFRPGREGVWNFQQRAHCLIRLRVDTDGGVVELGQEDLPLWSPARDGRTDLALGAGVLLHDDLSGASQPDGFLYVYGTWNRGFDKELVVARVRPEAAGDPAAWRFFDGERWSEALEDLAPVCGGVSSELSVTPLPDGRYLLVFQEGGMGEHVGLRLGVSPCGPFGPTYRIWRCPEMDLAEKVFCYNAKAHPHLSPPGEILVSYNVNSLDFWGEFLRDARIYRPRFLRLPLEWLEGLE